MSSKSKTERKVKKVAFQSPKGMHDMLPIDFQLLERVEKAVKKIAAFYDFQRLEPPVLEDIRLFERGTGLSSEIVSKQMFVVKTKKDNTLALRPEMTPGIMRAYIQNGLTHSTIPGKYYYWSPVFRYEQPQAGRFRQFTQLGFEILHADDPAYDVQIISASYKVLEEARLKGITVKLNSLGCKVCRGVYVRKIKEYYRDKVSKVCRDCAKRYSENPLRILDCKEERCQQYKERAPQALDYLCSTCKKHFKTVLEFLDDLSVPYMIDPTLVRGLDYYSKTVFELFVDQFESAVGGGGRYDYLSELLGGPRMGAVGSALGVERISAALKAQGASAQQKNQFKVFLIYMGDEAKRRAVRLLEDFYQANIPVKESFSKESLKAQLRVADKEAVDIALILGQREVFEEVIIVRDMKSGNQETIPLKKVVDEIKKRI